jgi:hypothetical protein
MYTHAHTHTHTYIFRGTEVSTRDFTFAKQVLYCLSHTSNAFCSDYFGGGGFLNRDPPNLSLPSS